jgi:hypothetical protein
MKIQNKRKTKKMTNTKLSLEDRKKEESYNESKDKNTEYINRILEELHGSY